jgi:hypothetical protein
MLSRTCDNMLPGVVVVLMWSAPDYAMAQVSARRLVPIAV